VCGGIAEYFDFSAWGVRCMFILLILLPIITLPLMLVLYAILACIMRKSPFSGRDRDYRY
jgi:phage shock protein PspC (stress-responsive transcriptional regulator)